jgi:trehalose-6-phosphate synthase
MRKYRTIAERHSSTSLHVPTSYVSSHYHCTCTLILQAFHNIDVLDLASCKWNPTEGDPTLSWDQANTTAWFDAFKALNQTFADHMERVLQENDVMWVHDYHLMLLPKMVADAEKVRLGRRRTSTIFFMHIPFPTSQVIITKLCIQHITLLACNSMYMAVSQLK